jgi:hypothetical protein
LFVARFAGKPDATFLIALQQSFAVQRGGSISAGGLRTGQAAGNA